MSDGGPTETLSAAARESADAAPFVATPGRPFSRPTPSNGSRPTPSGRPMPFVAPGSPELDVPPHREAESTATHPAIDTAWPAPRGQVASVEGPAGRDAGWPAEPVAVMAWAATRDVAAAVALESVARRLRAGSLRLPVAVDAGCEPAVIAAVLVALHADPSVVPPASTGDSIA